jgi:sugar lactone lactonase YvrE
VITTVAGNGTPGFSGDNGPATRAQLFQPEGVAVDSAGNPYIADRQNNRIRKVSNGVITTVAGGGTGEISVNGSPATNARLADPTAVAVDSAGNLYIGDAGTGGILEVSNGLITTVASSTIDNSLTGGLSVDSAGNLYVATGVQISKVSNGVITTVAGNGTSSFSGDNGPATSAQLNLVANSSIALDSAGNLYITDQSNERIRKVSNGLIATVAGNGALIISDLGDNGPATSAELHRPSGVAVDSAGNLYIADEGNDRIREVSNGVITTVAGNGTPGFSGDNGPATSAQLDLIGYAGAAVDSAGNLYLADNFNYRVREVSNGVITTVAGNGTPGSSGDNGPATSAQLRGPAGVAVDSAGNLYFEDGGFIRKVSNGVITTLLAKWDFR